MAANPNALFGFINVADINPGFWTPTFNKSYGNWQPSAPLEYLQNRFFAYKARSVNCSTDATRFVLDLGQTQAILCVAIPAHNLSVNATMRVRIYTDAALTALASSAADQTVQVATTFPWGSETFGDPQWFNGVITAEAARFFAQPAMVLFAAPQFGRYVLVEINDTSNAAGYVELDRLWISPGYQPSINVKYGAQVGVNDPTIVTRSLGGADFYDLRPKHRTVIAQIDYLPQNEAFVNFLMAQLRLGLSGQFFFCLFPADASLFAFTGFMATFTKLDPLTAALFGVQGVAIAIEEVIA